MSLALLFHYLMLSLFRMLVHPSAGACDLLWIYFVGVLLWFDVCWCYGVVRLGGVVSLCRLKLCYLLSVLA